MKEIKRSKEFSVGPDQSITPKNLFLNRRKFIQLMAGTAAYTALASSFPHQGLRAQPKKAGRKLKDFKKRTPGSLDQEITSYKEATTYNNFYEFGTDKYSPAKYAHQLVTQPWNVEITGEVKNKGKFELDKLIEPFPLEERVYRFRCVEAWSMVVPWIGFPLKSLIDQFEPTSKARWVEFTTLFDPKQMPAQNRKSFPWPYVEGLRLDEARHPLTLVAVGMYEEAMPNQNGAPIRLVVPWKYGFKSIKSIVKIRFTENQPQTTWNSLQPREYGFYANVNPEVDHPRWSQKSERRLGDLIARQPTLKFNGYEDQVASLYKGMDLRKYF